MIRNTIHTFDNETSLGIYKVPLEAIVHIENYKGRPRYVQKIAGTSITDTIEDFIDDTQLWREVSKDKLGALYDTTETYEVGDAVTRNNDIWVCTSPVTPSSFDINKWNSVSGNVTELGGVAWDSNSSYLVGDVVSEASDIYVARLQSIGANPSSDMVSWKLIQSGGITQLDGGHPGSVYTINQTIDGGIPSTTF